MMFLRNHAETVLDDKEELTNMIGHNYRLGEIEAAIGIQQFKTKRSIKNEDKSRKTTTNGLKDLKGLILPKVNYEYENVFMYIQ